jgi:hypothetical protein
VYLGKSYNRGMKQALRVRAKAAWLVLRGKPVIFGNTFDKPMTMPKDGSYIISNRFEGGGLVV